MSQLSESGQAIEELVALLDSPDRMVQHQAKEDLIEIGIEAQGALLKELSYATEANTEQTISDRKVWSILCILAMVADTRAVPQLKYFVNHGNHLQRVAAIECLGHVGGQEAICILANALAEADDESVIIWVAKALGMIASEEALMPLSRLLETTESHVVRYTAIDALGAIGSTGSIKLIQRFVQDPNHHVREHAEAALEQLAS